MRHETKLHAVQTPEPPLEEKKHIAAEWFRLLRDTASAS